SNSDSSTRRIRNIMRYIASNCSLDRTGVDPATTALADGTLAFREGSAIIDFLFSSPCRRGWASSHCAKKANLAAGMPGTESRTCADQVKPRHKIIARIQPGYCNQALPVGDVPHNPFTGAFAGLYLHGGYIPESAIHLPSVWPSA